MNFKGFTVFGNAESLFRGERQQRRLFLKEDIFFIYRITSKRTQLHQKRKNNDKWSFSAMYKY